jgi:hypothetical protein
MPCVDALTTSSGVVNQIERALLIFFFFTALALTESRMTVFSGL